MQPSPFTSTPSPTAHVDSHLWHGSPGPATVSGHALLRQWLVGRRNDGATPDVICAQLVATGWDADSAASVSLSSLRTGDRHRLLYISLCWGAGLAALFTGSAVHLALARRSDPLELATAITCALVAAPIAVIAAMTARKVEAQDAHAIWSPTRRTLFGVLCGSAAAVGIIRLLHYLFHTVAAAVGARGYEFTPASVVQVLVSLCISVPLFWWSLQEWRRSNVALRSLTKPTTATLER